MDDSVISYIQYIQENTIGLLLLLLVFVIIYCVDNINQINSLIFASSSPIPGISAQQIPQIIPKLNGRPKRNKKN